MCEDMMKDCCHPQVVLQVVIAFIVDAFVLQLQKKKMKQKEKKNLEQNNEVDDADCLGSLHTERKID